MACLRFTSAMWPMRRVHSTKPLPHASMGAKEYGHIAGEQEACALHVAISARVDPSVLTNVVLREVVGASVQHRFRAGHVAARAGGEEEVREVVRAAFLQTPLEQGNPATARCGLTHGRVLAEATLPGPQWTTSTLPAFANYPGMRSRHGRTQLWLGAMSYDPCARLTAAHASASVALGHLLGLRVSPTASLKREHAERTMCWSSMDG